MKKPPRLRPQTDAPNDPHPTRRIRHITAKLTPEEHELLAAIAHREDRTVTYMVRKLIVNSILSQK